MTVKSAKLVLGKGRDTAAKPVTIKPPPDGKRSWRIPGTMVLEDSPQGRKVIERTGCFDHQ